MSCALDSCLKAFSLHLNNMSVRRRSPTHPRVSLMTHGTILSSPLCNTPSQILLCRCSPLYLNRQSLLRYTPIFQNPNVRRFVFHRQRRRTLTASHDFNSLLFLRRGWQPSRQAPIPRKCLPGCVTCLMMRVSKLDVVETEAVSPLSMLPDARDSDK